MRRAIVVGVSVLVVCVLVPVAGFAWAALATSRSGGTGWPSPGICQRGPARVVDWDTRRSQRATYLSGWTHSGHVHIAGESMVWVEGDGPRVVSDLVLRCEGYRRPR